MAFETFTWNDAILSGASGTESYRVLTAQFGDGYKQQAADGINNVIQTWSLTFKSTSLATIQAIRGFLKAKGGYKKFYWTPPLGEQGLYTVAQLGILAEVGSDYTLTATFEEAFVP